MIQRFRARRAAAFVISAAALGSVTLTTGCSNGRFGNMISKSQEVQLGQEASKDVERQSKIITSGPEYDQVQRVAARVIPLAQRDYDVPYSVKLIDSKEVNAFALPGGPIYFYKGLINLTTSDDEVASVLSHEATHVVKRHSVKQISDAQTKDLIAQLAFGRAGGLARLGASLALNLDQLKFSRDDEAQADEQGFRYLTEAGYRPAAMGDMFRKLQKAEGKGGGSNEFLQNHPLTRKRIEAADARAAAYEKTQSIP